MRLPPVSDAHDCGSTSTEYALLATLIAVAVAIGIAMLGTAVLGLFDSGAELFP